MLGCRLCRQVRLGSPPFPRSWERRVVIKPRKPWKSLDEVEITTAEWVDCFNDRSLYEYCGDITPAEFEKAYYARSTVQELAGMTV